MGVGIGPNGSVTVTDDDTIEKSNLSRQFLFRNRDIGRSVPLMLQVPLLMDQKSGSLVNDVRACDMLMAQQWQQPPILNEKSMCKHRASACCPLVPALLPA